MIRRIKKRGRRLAGGGVVKLRKGEAGRVAAELVKQFQACGRPSEDRRSLVAAPPDYISVCTHAHDPEAYVCVTPTPHPSGDLVPGGSFRRPDQIRVKVAADQCASPDDWARRLREVLTHELTHAADPYTRVRRTRYAKATSQADYCAYVRDPTEVAANLAEVRAELLAATTRKEIRIATRRGAIQHPEQVLEESPRYREINDCLTPRIRRRFLQMAARLWTSGKLGPLPHR